MRNLKKSYLKILVLKKLAIWTDKFNLFQLPKQKLDPLFFYKLVSSVLQYPLYEWIVFNNKTVRSLFVCACMSMCVSTYECCEFVIFFYHQMVPPKLISKELFLTDLELSIYKLNISKVLINIMITNPNVFLVYMIWENAQY